MTKPKQRLRILFVVEHFPCLSETFVLNQVTGLLDLGHHVEIYPLGKPVAPVVHQDFEKYQLQERTWRRPEIPQNKLHRLARAVRHLPACLRRFPLAVVRSLNAFRHGRPAANLSLFYSLLPFLKHRDDFDVVHCHFGDKGVLAQLWKDWGVVRGRVSVVFHAHEMAGLSDQQGSALYGDLFASDATLLPISNHWRDLLTRWGAQANRTIVHHMGVNCDQIRFEAKSVALSQPIQLVSISRLTEMKGTEFAIRAVAQLRAKYPSLRYTVAGDGPLRKTLERLAAELGVREVVTFVGPQTQDEVRELLREAHIFLCPSVTDSTGCTEGIPVALMEAMAAGVPAVATIHAGIPELITDGISGLLVSERDVNGLAEATARLIASPELYASIACAGRKKIECDFEIKGLNKRLVQLFDTGVQSLATGSLPQ